VSQPVSRRQFIVSSTASSLALAATLLPGAALLSSLSPDGPPDDSSALYTVSHSLTALWAAKLLDLQVRDAARPQEYGGILCPTEHIVHGRVGDTIYPFLHMAHRTGDSRYVDASVLLFRWIESHVSQPDGSWLNEPKDNWKGTTVFSVIALCEALRYHSDWMEPAFKTAIQTRLQKAGNFIYDNVTIDYGNINYPLSASYALSLLGTLQDEPRFREKGKLLSHQALNFFSRNDHFIFGEGTPYYQASKKGCFSVDLGYNVEESLPSLALYGLLNKDEELLEMVTRSLQTHMEFMLPDGGWDNSWGTRNYKWTWWGSRTSDGCQPAYALLAHRDPRFYRVALKNTQLLERCTIDGLLYGGPHYASHHIPPSVHHTFCHIKALTTILDHAQAPAPATGHPASPSLLPRETAYGSRFFTDIQTWLISTGDYRATVTGYDREYKAMHNGHATGGALTLLWHEATGPLLTASMNAYQMVEAGNMQPDNDPLSMPLTPRMELITEGTTYMNISHLDATIAIEEKTQQISIRTISKLVDKDQHDPAKGAVYCYANYIFTPKKISLSFRFSETPYKEDIRIVLPVISPTGESVKPRDEKTIHIKKEKALVTLTADQPIQRLPTTGERLFNFVPGLEAIPFAINRFPASVDIMVEPLR
jgi:hypothetical protein